MKTQIQLIVTALIVYIFSAVSLKGQSVFPSFSDNPHWNVLQTFWFEDDLVQYSFSADTVFCANTYSKYYDYYFRTEEKKVFMRAQNDCDNPEYLVYDFGLEVGDTMVAGYFNDYINPTEFRVDAIDTITYFGVNRKRMLVGFNICGGPLVVGGYVPMYWIEGIGSDMHPLYPVYCMCGACESWATLWCYDSSGVQLFGNPYEGACDIIIDVPNLLAKTLKIFPNPASDILFFSPENSEEYIYNIRTITNEILLKNKTYGPLEVNIKGLLPGIYLFELLDTEGHRIAAEKFVKL